MEINTFENHLLSMNYFKRCYTRNNDLSISLHITEARIEFKIQLRDPSSMLMLNPRKLVSVTMYDLLLISLKLLNILKFCISLWLRNNLMTNFSVEIKKGEILKM